MAGCRLGREGVPKGVEINLRLVSKVDAHRGRGFTLSKHNRIVTQGGLSG